LITLDNGFANTGACLSKITYLEGQKGILRYRGYPIEQVAEQATFVETCYLLIHGELPTKDQLDSFLGRFQHFYELSDDMLKLYSGYPRDGHPMGLLSSMVCSLSAYYPEVLKGDTSTQLTEDLAAELLSKVATISAFTFKRCINEDLVPPRKDLDYIPNFLHMMFSTPQKEYEINDDVVKAIRALLILHADHEQNCSTSTVRLVGSSWANLFASISAGVCALWGPLHGGANQKVVEMLQEMHAAGGDVDSFINKAKDSSTGYRLMGFGHRIYKNYDPRARIIKRRCYEVFESMGINDPLLDIALKLEEKVLKDDYFVERRLYPNVDFYSGLIYKAIGLPTVMFPVMFAIGRMPGWIAHWMEMRQNPKSRIGRPRQVYMGENERQFVPIQDR
jgi:citrate synthase